MRSPEHARANAAASEKGPLSQEVLHGLKASRWVRNYYDATAPLSEEGGYVNFMAADDQDRIKANYRGNYERLVEVKRTYDPGNLFHLNQNIKP